MHGTFWKLLCISACLVFAAFVTSASEPKHKGKTLSKWLQLYTMGNTNEQHQAETALQSIGTNALPFFTRWLAETGDDEHMNVPNGFAILGEKGSPSVPILTRLLQSTNELTAFLAAQSLAQIGRPALPVLLSALTNKNYRISLNAALTITDMGTNALPAISIFLEQLKDRNPKIRQRAADRLGALALEPNLVVPALTNALNDSFRSIIFTALDSLGQFETNANSATPVLLELLKHPDGDLRYAATNALRSIAPEVFTNKTAQ